MLTKLMDFKGAKILTKEEQKVIVGGTPCGCQGDNTARNFRDPVCHEC